MLQANMRTIDSFGRAEAGRIFFIGMVFSFGCFGATCSVQNGVSRVSRKSVVQPCIVYVAAAGLGSFYQ